MKIKHNILDICALTNIKKCNKNKESFPASLTSNKQEEIENKIAPNPYSLFESKQYINYLQYYTFTMFSKKMLLLIHKTN